MTKKSKDVVLAEMNQAFEPESYKKIRDLWKHHSICEDNRDIEGILSTLVPRCRYEIVNTELVWEGKAGAAQFYQALLTAIPGAKFELQEIVVGPQGVFEEAILTGVHKGDYLQYRASNKPINVVVGIFFPWDSKTQLFTGEKIYIDLDKAFASDRKLG